MKYPLHFKKPCPDEATIAGYVDNLLQPDERDAVDKHLANCEGCREIVKLCYQMRDEQTP